MADVYEKDGQMGIDVEMPGVDPKDVKISVDNGRLSISYEKKREEETKDKKYYRVERSFNSFSRSFLIPEGTDESKIIADYKNGVLSIKVPKQLKENKAREIPIKT
jgi:HSP20 family protein